MSKTESPNQFLKGSVRVGRKIGMPNYGSFTLEFEEDFLLCETTHEAVADRLVEKIKQKLQAWGAVR
jgi:hypothetical protein